MAESQHRVLKRSKPGSGAVSRGWNVTLQLGQRPICFGLGIPRSWLFFDSRNPGRCPGLECGGAFSAGIKVVQIQIHEASWLAIYEMASRNNTTKSKSISRIFIS